MGASRSDRSTWERKYGRIRIDAKGRPVYVIRKQKAGRRYEVSTGCHTLRAAEDEWEKFDKNPAAYMAARSVGPLLLDNKRAEAFLAYSLREKKNTVAWVAKQRTDLAWWMERLGGIDLRHVTARDHLAPALEGVPGRGHKIAVVKGLYRWLRKEQHVITSAEDASLDLASPKARAAQLSRSKVVPLESIKAVLGHLDSPWRDALMVQAGTGMHITETMRFAAAGSIETLPAGAVEGDAAGVLLCPLHKSGDPLRVRVSAPVLEAAGRLREHGGFSNAWYFRHVKDACVAAGVPPFSPGMIRHSVATLAVNSGATVAAVAAYLHHRSPQTTKRFYATHASAAKVPTLL